MNETWTTTHDLALLFLALAYGTDHTLSDAELSTITELLQEWEPEASREAVQEIVLEAMAVFLEKQPEDEVVGAIQSLRQSLSQEQRLKALGEVVEVAEADGVLLSSERNLITIVSEAWGMKRMGERLVGREVEEASDEWGLLHDMVLMYLVVAHSTDNELVDEEIAAMIDRLKQWQPEYEEEQVRAVIRQVLTFYGQQPDKESLQGSIGRLGASLPPLQRLALLDDLVHIAQADGSFSPAERDMILNLSRHWRVRIRLGGVAEA